MGSTSSFSGAAGADWKTYALSGLGAVVLALAGVVANGFSERFRALEARAADLTKSRDERTIELARLERDVEELKRRDGVLLGRAKWEEREGPIP